MKDYIRPLLLTSPLTPDGTDPLGPAEDDDGNLYGNGSDFGGGDFDPVTPPPSGEDDGFGPGDFG